MLEFDNFGVEIFVLDFEFGHDLGGTGEGLSWLELNQLLECEVSKGVGGGCAERETRLFAERVGKSGSVKIGIQCIFWLWVFRAWIMKASASESWIKGVLLEGLVHLGGYEQKCEFWIKV